jgi:hypothetical protein
MTDLSEGGVTPATQKFGGHPLSPKLEGALPLSTVKATGALVECSQRSPCSGILAMSLGGESRKYNVHPLLLEIAHGRQVVAELSGV